MSYKILTEFPQDFINFLDVQVRHPKMIMKYALPIAFGNSMVFNFRCAMVRTELITSKTKRRKNSQKRVQNLPQ